MQIPGTEQLSVTEVLEFISNKSLLKESGSIPDGLSIHRAHAFTEISRFVFDGIDDASPSWNDLRARESIPFYGEENRLLAAEITKWLENLRPWLESEVRSQLAGRVPVSAIEVTIGTIEDVLAMRAAFGKSLDFWEFLFRVYMAGGLPFGWIGCFPTGSLEVYFPNSSSD